MASSVVSHKCVADRECKKNGIIKCDGCSSRFCADHFPTHRRELDARLEVICSDRDAFYHEFAQTSQEPIESLAEIDLWEQQTLAHVKKTASNARQRVREMETGSNNNRKLDQFSEELRRPKENDDYFEQDIERLAQQLEQIKIESKQLFQINISYTPIGWKTIIQINNKQSFTDLFRDTSLLNFEQQQRLNYFFGNLNQQWQLVYRGTRDGFRDNVFIRCSENQGPTLTLILANKYLFGGFTNASWKNITKGVWSNDPTAFLFTLTNPRGIPPTKYPIKSTGENATGSFTGCGPIFGMHDIFIEEFGNKNTRGTSRFPRNYCDTTGMGSETFTGASSFEVSEIEVYRKV
jgi:outer membrane murein-binding lipoprotein Lpp